MSVFVWDVNKLTYNSKVTRDKWNVVISDSLSLVSLLKTASKVDLSDKTIFRMRHKFLLVLEDLIGDNLFSDVIVCDETYMYLGVRTKSWTIFITRGFGCMHYKRRKKLSIY